MEPITLTSSTREPWNKGKLVSQKTPFKLKEIWAIRVRLQIASRCRDLALFNHNLSWEAPHQLAADIERFVRSGEPTRDLYRSDAPRDIQKIIEEPGKAIIVSSRPLSHAEK